MAVGQILREALLHIETFTVKASEDIEKGELVCDDGSGNGIVAATAALAVAEKVMMALVAHVYATEEAAGRDHDIECVVTGFVEAQKISQAGLAQKGDKLMISGTAGEVTKFVKGDPPTGGVSTHYTTVIEAGIQTALDVNAGIVGVATEVSTDADVTQKMLLGVVG